MEEIKIFENPAFGKIRTAGTSDKPLFCLADICKVVELTNPSSVKGRLDAEDVQLIDLHALNRNEGEVVGNTLASFVTESNNMPYQRYVDCGYFRTIEQKFATPDGEVRVSIKTIVYQKGVDFIRKTLKGMGYKEVEVA